MHIKGVITGDLVASTQLTTSEKGQLLEYITQVPSHFSELTPIKVEVFRGDSFQLLIDCAEESLTVATILRAGLKMQTLQKSPILWDARLSLGLGDVSYDTERVTTSDGEAFHNSGWAFDEIGKRRLTIRTPWSDINDELYVSTAFADDIITNWTSTQSKAIYYTLLTKQNQLQIASILKTSNQNVSKLLSTAKGQLIENYLQRFKQIIKQYQSTL